MTGEVPRSDPRSGEVAFVSTPGMPLAATAQCTAERQGGRRKHTRWSNDTVRRNPWLARKWLDH